MKNISVSKVVASICMVVALIVGGFAGATLFPTETIVTKNVTVTETEYVDVPGPVVTEIETVEVENPVNEALEQANVELLEQLEQADADMDIVTAYLEDKGIFEDAIDVVKEIKAEDEALLLAINMIKEDYADELEDEDIVKDEDDADLIKVYSELEDIEVVRSDYEDNEYKFKILAKVEDDDKDDKFKVEFVVEVEDGEAKIKNVSKYVD